MQKMFRKKCLQCYYGYGLLNEENCSNCNEFLGEGCSSCGLSPYDLNHIALNAVLIIFLEKMENAKNVI